MRQSVSVTVRPKGIVFDVAVGQSVYEAAIEQGVRWPTTCEGAGTCHMCFMSVIEGAEDLNSIEPFEAEGLDAVVDPVREGTLRLACQARPEGDLVVVKRGVRKALRVDRSLPGRRSKTTERMTLEERHMSKKLVQRNTNMVFALLPDGTVQVEDPATGRSGVFKRDGTPISGDLSYADQVMLDYVAGAYNGPQE